MTQSGPVMERTHEWERGRSAIDVGAVSVDAWVEVVGIQEPSKIPTVCGIDVDGPDQLAGRQVVARGILKRAVVTDVDPYSANRGPGVYYSLVDPSGGALVKPKPYPPTQ